MRAKAMKIHCMHNLSCFDDGAAEAAVGIVCLQEIHSFLYIQLLVGARLY